MAAMVFISSPTIAMFSPELVYSCFGCLHLITLGSDERASIFVFEMRGFKRHLSGTAFPKKPAVWLASFLAFKYHTSECHACYFHASDASELFKVALLVPWYTWKNIQISSSLDHRLWLLILSLGSSKGTPLPSMTFLSVCV